MRKGNGFLTKMIDFVEAKGFYIVLVLCALAIGVSGYVLLFSGGNEEEEELTVTVAATTTTARPTLRSTGTTKKTSPPSTTAPSSSTEAAKPSGTSGALSVAHPVNIDRYVMPVKGEIIRGYSAGDLVYDETMADWRTHNGIDIACAEGTEVVAVGDGTVISAVKDELRGGVVTIEHEGGIISSYYGLGGSGEVKQGQRVDAGQLIGYTAANIKTESMLQPHLHLEITRDGLFIDPEELGIE